MLFFTFEKHFMENPEMNPNLLRLWWMEGVLLPLTVCNACRTAFGLFALLGKSQPKLLERRQTECIVSFCSGWVLLVLYS